MFTSAVFKTAAINRSATSPVASQDMQSDAHLSTGLDLYNQIGTLVRAALSLLSTVAAGM